MSDHQLVQLLQQLFQHLLSISALVFNRHFATIPQFSQLFYTKFEPSPLFSAKISNSASTAARTTVSCLYSAHARAPLQGPGGIGTGTCLSLGGAPFFEAVFETCFFHNKHMFFTRKLLRNYHKIHSESDLGLNFLDFEHTLFLNGSTLFLQYFHGSARSKQYQKHFKLKLQRYRF